MSNMAPGNKYENFFKVWHFKAQYSVKLWRNLWENFRDTKSLMWLPKYPAFIFENKKSYDASNMTPGNKYENFFEVWRSRTKNSVKLWRIFCTIRECSKVLFNNQNTGLLSLTTTKLSGLKHGSRE